MRFDYLKTSSILCLEGIAKSIECMGKKWKTTFSCCTCLLKPLHVNDKFYLPPPPKKGEHIVLQLLFCRPSSLLTSLLERCQTWYNECPWRVDEPY